MTKAERRKEWLALPYSVLTTIDVARCLAVSANQAGKLCKAGALPGFNLGNGEKQKSWRITIKAFDWFVRGRLIDPFEGPLVVWPARSQALPAAFVTMATAQGLLGLNFEGVIAACDEGKIASIHVGLAVDGEKITRRISRLTIEAYLATKTTQNRKNGVFSLITPEHASNASAISLQAIAKQPEKKTAVSARNSARRAISESGANRGQNEKVGKRAK